MQLILGTRVRFPSGAPLNSSLLRGDVKSFVLKVELYESRSVNGTWDKIPPPLDMEELIAAHDRLFHQARNAFDVCIWDENIDHPMLVQCHDGSSLSSRLENIANAMRSDPAFEFINLEYDDFFIKESGN